MILQQVDWERKLVQELADLFRSEAIIYSCIENQLGNLSERQAKRVVKAANKVDDGLEIESRITIVPGKSTQNIPEIKSPEEFFQRSGTRAPTDPAPGKFTPSGSISATPDRKIIIIPAGEK